MKIKLVRLVLATMLAAMAVPAAAFAEARAVDPNPPKLISASVSCENATMGDTVVISWDIEDADGIASVSVEVDVPGGSQMMLPSLLGEDASKGRAEIDITSSMTAGEYRVSSIKVEDKSGYVTEITSGLENLVFSVDTSGSDKNPPVLQSASVAPKTASVGDIVAVSWEISDADGVESVGVVVDCPDGSQMSLGSPMNSPQKNSCEIEVTSDMTPGLYKVSAFEVQDAAGYRTTISVENESLEFTVESAGPDPNAAKIIEASIDRRVATVGDTVTIAWKVEDADGVKLSEPIISCPDGAEMMLGSPLDQEKTCISELHITSDMTEGEYKLIAIKVVDKLGYVAELSAINLGLSFTVVGEGDAPEYKVIEGDNTEYVAGSDAGLRFRFTGPAERFMLLEVDGDVVDEDFYTVESGSTIITLSSDYLDTLDAGEHVATAYYDDGGRALATFDVVEDEDNGSSGVNGEGNASTKDDTERDTKDDGRLKTKTSSDDLAQTGDVLPLQLTTLMVAAASLMVIAVARRRSIEPWE